jgi:thiosulfate/3-mercaptopyruvate sulfurtransferase
MGDRRQKWRRWVLPLALLITWGLYLGAAAPIAQAVPQGGYAHPEVLIQAEELKALMDQKDPQIRIIDVRHKAKYYLGHIPGAVQVWRPEMEDKKSPLPGMPAQAAQMEKLLSRLGITNRDTLILYSDQFDHTRLWWLLAYYGFPLNLMKLLDGGLEAWKAKGYPTQLTSPQVARSSFKLPASAQRKSLAATLDEVKGAVSEQSKVILDDRSQRQYLGEEREEGAARPGRIPGSVWVEWKETRVAEGPFKGFFKNAEEIKKIYAARGITPDKDIYLYSNLGQPSTHSLVSLYLAGYPLEKLHLYAGSWTEWSRSKESIKTGPPGTIKGTEPRRK